MDLYSNYVLSASWRPEKPLQLWDLRTCGLVKDYNWVNHAEPCMLYAGQFSKDPMARHVIGGGSGSNEARIYERESGNMIGSMRGMRQGVYSVDFHPTSSQVAIASGDGTVRTFDYSRPPAHQ